MTLEERDFGKLVDFLNAHGGLDAREEYERTALMECCIGRMSVTDASYAPLENDFAQALVKLGADINLKDKAGYTALMYVVQNNNKGMIDFLLGQPGLDMGNLPDIICNALFFHIRDSELLIKLVRAGNPFPNNDTGVYERILEFQTGEAARGDGPVDMTGVLQVLNELYPDIVDHVEPFFLESVKYDYLAAEFRALLNKKNSTLLLKFADEHGGINGVDEYGRTPLMNCMFSYSDSRFGRSLKNITTTYAKKLIAMKADIYLQDKKGRTALDWAVKNKNAEITELLQSLISYEGQ